MNTASLLFYAVAIIAAYAFIANRMLAVGAHFRMRALDLGTQLLEDPKVPAHLKPGIENWLCDIPNRLSAWAIVLVTTPALIVVVVRRWRGVPAVKEGMPSTSAPYWKTWDDFVTYSLIATLCNSPLAFVLGILQLLFGVSFVRSNYAVWVTVNRMLHRDKDGMLHQLAH